MYSEEQSVYQDRDEAKRDVQVTVELRRNDEAIDRLVKNVEVLERRLERVLRSDTPPDTAEPARIREALVPLASTIQTHGDRLNQLASRVNDLTNRLEV